MVAYFWHRQINFQVIKTPACFDIKRILYVEKEERKLVSLCTIGAFVLMVKILYLLLQILQIRFLMYLNYENEQNVVKCPVIVFEIKNITLRFCNVFISNVTSSCNFMT